MKYKPTNKQTGGKLNIRGEDNEQNVLSFTQNDAETYLF